MSWLHRWTQDGFYNGSNFTFISFLKNATGNILCSQTLISIQIPLKDPHTLLTEPGARMSSASPW